MRNVTPPVAFSAGKRLVFCGGILGATSLITNSIKKKKKTLIPQLKSLHDILVLRRINRKREGQPSRLMSRGRSPSYCVTFKGSRVMQKSRLSRRRGDEERRGGGAAQKPLTENWSGLVVPPHRCQYSSKADVFANATTSNQRPITKSTLMILFSHTRRMIIEQASCSLLIYPHWDENTLDFI